MAVIATVLNRSNARPTEDLILKFLEHFALVRRALNGLGLWNEEDGFFYDQLVAPDGSRETIKVHSMVGAIPLLATVVLDEEVVRRLGRVGKQCVELVGQGAEDLDELDNDMAVRGAPGDRRLLLGVVEIARVERLVRRLLDEEEFLSPHGLRSLSKYHLAHPYEVTTNGLDASINYEPAESTTHMFGGNSNWRGPVWFPLNHLACDALERLGRFYLDEVTVEYPSGSGTMCTYGEVADGPATSAHLHLPHRAGRPPTVLRRDRHGSRTTRGGATACSSTSTSTATTARASARRTRPDGRASWRTSSSGCTARARRPKRTSSQGAQPSGDRGRASRWRPPRCAARSRRSTARPRPSGSPPTWPRAWTSASSTSTGPSRASPSSPRRRPAPGR